MTHSSIRILLVDDEVGIQRTVGPLLRSKGYDVEVAGTGTEALAMFEARTPDLIVLDLGLPDIEGTEVCRRIARSRSADHRPFGTDSGARQGERARAGRR